MPETLRTKPPFGSRHRRRVVSEKSDNTHKSRQHPNCFLGLWTTLSGSNPCLPWQADRSTTSAQGSKYGRMDAHFLLHTMGNSSRVTTGGIQRANTDRLSGGRLKRRNGTTK